MYANLLLHILPAAVEVAVLTFICVQSALEPALRIAAMYAFAQRIIFQQQLVWHHLLQDTPVWVNSAFCLLNVHCIHSFGHWDVYCCMYLLIHTCMSGTQSKCSCLQTYSVCVHLIHHLSVIIVNVLIQMMM